MKIKINLFPHKYACEPRDYRAIFLMVISIIVSIILIISIFIVTQMKISNFKEASEAEVNILRGKKQKLKREEQGKLTKINSENFSNDKKIALNERIKEFNKIKRDFYWGTFFQKLEDVTPKNIWVKNLIIETDEIKKIREDEIVNNLRRNGVLTPENEQNVRNSINRRIYIACEAEDWFKPVEFVKNLELSDYFLDILLGKAEENDESQAVSFTIEFDLNEQLLRKGN